MRDHFKLPGDGPTGISPGESQAGVENDADADSDEEYDADMNGDNEDEMVTHCLLDDHDRKTLVISHRRGLAQAAPPAVVRIDQDDVTDALEDLNGFFRLRITGMNGNWCEEDIPALYTSLRAPRAHVSTIVVPGTSLVLTRHTVRVPELDNNDGGDEKDVVWGALLHRWHRKGGGRLAYAKCIRLAVSNTELSGGEIAYSDGTTRRMGQPDDDGHDETHLRVLRRRRDVFAVRQVAVQVGRAPHTAGQLVGCQMVLGDDNDSVAWGDLVGNREYPAYVLRPATDARVVGFCGRADRCDRTASEFGILTAPRAVVDGPAGLPRELYDMPEFMGLKDWDYESSDYGDDGDDDNMDEN